MQMLAWRKIREAHFFYGLMVDHAADYEHFAFCLSAFLAACRSIKDYLQREDPRLVAWYTTGGYEEEPLLKYFRMRRDLEVHLRGCPVIT